MLPTRESFITALIQSKLSLRRIYRNWRRTRPADKRVVPVFAPDSSDLSDDLRTRPRRPAELPARPPDRAPLPHFVLLPALFVLALAVRLVRIAYPPSVVFDEVHFLRFTREYYYGEYFFDIHPPLGKLVLLLVTYLFCGAPKELSTNGSSFGDQRYVPLRVTSAVFGAALSPLCYLIAREFGLSVPASLFPALVQAVEHLGVIESRLVLLDAQLLFWIAVSLLCALRMWGKPRLRRWPLVCATALSGSAALSVKWTALTTPALIAIVSLLGGPFPAERLAVEEMGVAGVLAATLYIFLFYVHFRMLPKSGQGDAFMRDAFKKTLIGSKRYVAGYRGPGFVRNFLYLNYEMYIANKGIKARHHWESKYWQWILNKRGLLYYTESPEKDYSTVEKIYLIVNPAVTVITNVSLVLCVGLSVLWLYRRWRAQLPIKKRLERRKMHAFVVRGAFLLAGYVLNILPYVEVARCTFLYHYLPALFYALFCVANLIDLIPNARAQRVVSATLFALVLVAFWVWLPWIYATNIPLTKHIRLRLENGWD